jgi:hypothetical protein
MNTNLSEQEKKIRELEAKIRDLEDTKVDKPLLSTYVFWISLYLILCAIGIAAVYFAAT